MFSNMRAMRIPGRQKDEERSKLEGLGRYGPASAEVNSEDADRSVPTAFDTPVSMNKTRLYMYQ